jgi:hypothetical protein
MWPIRDTGYMSMRHGIKVDVVDMAREISVIANRVLPIPTLLDTLFALRRFAFRSRPRFDPPGKPALDEAPSDGKIRIMLRQGPKRVEVIGQDANRNRFKRAAVLEQHGRPAVTDRFL